MIGAEALKPLKVRYRPSENSHTAIGRVASADAGETVSMTPNSRRRTDAKRMGAPMSPSIGRARGTRPERYRRVPRSRALMTGMRVWPTRNVPL